MAFMIASACISSTLATPSTGRPPAEWEGSNIECACDEAAVLFASPLPDPLSPAAVVSPCMAMLLSRRLLTLLSTASGLVLAGDVRPLPSPPPPPPPPPPPSLPSLRSPPSRSSSFPMSDFLGHIFSSVADLRTWNSFPPLVALVNPVAHFLRAAVFATTLAMRIRSNRSVGLVEALDAPSPSLDTSSTASFASTSPSICCISCSSYPTSVSGHSCRADSLRAASTSPVISCRRCRANSSIISPSMGCRATSRRMSSRPSVLSWHWRVAVVVYGRVSDNPARQMTPKKSPPFMGDDRSSSSNTLRRTMPERMMNILSAGCPSRVKISFSAAWYVLSSQHTSESTASVSESNRGTRRSTEPYMCSTRSERSTSGSRDMIFDSSSTVRVEYRRS
mmetsp:Transcript_7508/g.18630  ORF Transcript_7508/g.18630 Transcript_7508/m.18630 type:complete len:392 (-) Transcript_7508:1131-2306(-)